MNKWKKVLHFEDFYLVNRLGKIKSIRSGKILKPRDNGKGYKYIDFRIKGVITRRYIHSVVASHFVKNHYNKP